MPRTCLLLALFVLTACGTCLPQQRLSRPRPALLRVTVSYDGTTKVRDATVELQDAVGGSSAMDHKITDQDGRVEFNTVTGTHRIRISGAEFHPYEGEFEITPAENYHFENIVVRRKTDGQGFIVTPGGQSTVPAVRLNIPDKARKAFEKGSKALQDQEWESSRQFFQAAVDLYPDYDLAYNGLGMACWQLNDVVAARAALLKATQLTDNFAEAQRNLVVILLQERERNYEEVAARLKLSLNVEPMNAWALTKAAYAELRLGRFTEAAEHALRVHGLPHEGLADAHVIAGYALEAMGQKEQAAAEFQLYMKENPKGLDFKRAQAALARVTSLPPR